MDYAEFDKQFTAANDTYNSDWEVDLLSIVRNGWSPTAFNFGLLIDEIEESLSTRVISIPVTSCSPRNFCFWFKLSNRADIIARLGPDINRPNFVDFPMVWKEWHRTEALFEAAVHELLHDEREIPIQRLIYSRAPVQLPEPRTAIPLDLVGRSLFVYEMVETILIYRSVQLHPKGPLKRQAIGVPAHQWEPDRMIFDRLVRARAALFRYDPPLDFCVKHFQELFPTIFARGHIPVPVTPTREFWLFILRSLIETVVRDEGEVLGLITEGKAAGQGASRYRNALLTLLPHILPPEDIERPLYRFVIDRRDFGFHNLQIDISSTGESMVVERAHFDNWSRPCILPAFLSDPSLFLPTVKAIENIGGGNTDSKEAWDFCAKVYFEELYGEVPSYQAIMKKGKVLRYLWSKLQNYDGKNSVGYFHDMCVVVEEIMRNLK